MKRLNMYTTINIIDYETKYTENVTIVGTINQKQLKEIEQKSKARWQEIENNKLDHMYYKDIVREQLQEKGFEIIETKSCEIYY